jgi:hypothetical protein
MIKASVWVTYGVIPKEAFSKPILLMKQQDFLIDIEIVS